MLHLRQAILETNGKSYHLQPGKSNSFPELHVDFQQNAERYGERYTVFLHPKQDLDLRSLELQFSLQTGPTARFLANGFQSWSETRSFHPHEKIPRLRFLARKRMGFYGDEYIDGIPRGQGYLHSWTYSTLTEAGQCLLMGSLNEHTGFTLWLYDHHNAVLTVRKDLAGLHLTHSFPGLDVWIGEGSEKELYDRYFTMFMENAPYHAITPPKKRGILGWTSWYRHFNKISEQGILSDLNAVAASGLPFQYFQIDDGWQKSVGDWLSVSNGFSGGMYRLAAEIRNKGLQAGLWLAPFVASRHSELATQHPDWLLKDRRGRPLRAGWNPLWGGWFYALDIYHPRVQEYLSGVFHMARDKWGYELFKLDFLFAACLAPPKGKTRGQVMADAMEFLRRQLGNSAMLACGAPLGTAFGISEYCRIGGDIHLSWEHRLLAWLRHRERVSTVASLRSTLHRWQLQRRAFGNDPDVFILRNDHQQLGADQQHTVLIINALLGALLFTSDDLSAYSEEQKSEVQAALLLAEARVVQVAELLQDVFRIVFELDGATRYALVNLNARAVSVPITNGRMSLRPFETRIVFPQDAEA
ncbi:MAG TPA: alpha-galactosidase [Saprospiraceae bacterium]|nr:alpha-galactosidase [Saprospiraceae bacterium]HNM25388.1 alpha-galactosidase [Saprospiraceae bacterium]